MTVPNHLTDFEAQLDSLRQDSEYSELPTIDMSMYAEDTCFKDDLGDDKYYNDIFIEHRTDKSSGFRYIVDVAFLAHNFVLAIILYNLFSSGWGSVSFGMLVIPAMAWLFLLLEVGGARTGGMRFNRQAQMVHVATIGGAYSIPWRSAKPFFNHGVHGGDLRLCFPKPNHLIRNDGVEERREERNTKLPFYVHGTLDWRDVGFNGSLLRLEFYRRYMEKGLGAVQPDLSKVDKTEIHPPSQTQQSHPEHGAVLHWIARPIRKLVWLFAGGPLIDRLVRSQAGKFKWPEKIEQLCTPGADLSGIDTTPVKPRKDIFYRPRGLDGIELVNANGQRIG
ncbi:hypothetical protein [Halomonas binhaiensis]|uniref:Uncharacterized protein n=1 Tax=Halomonas binhaiensis TaxID=2562282 RepID=A0A5C1NIN8_9GAMM|nr:hypothetical protein [Halomonas binhaiensis]QEM82117.1 hypothetical protein E4T21_11580 [Halomonas binhaiensis]